MAKKIEIQGGDYLDLNKAVLNIDNENTIEKIKNLLMARLIVLTIMSRRNAGQHFQHIPNVADLAIFVAIGRGENSKLRNFLDALYFIKIGNRPRADELHAINANRRNQSHIKDFFNSKVCISGKLTMNKNIRANITFDTFDKTKLLPEEIEWLKYIDEENLFL